MLTDEDKQKIRAEEIYRQEVRNSFADKLTAFGKFYQFLQSSLGIWFLSTVVVGFITLAANQWVKQSQVSDEARATERALFVEIAYRINKIDTLTKSSESRLKSLNASTPWTNKYIDDLAQLRELLAITWRTFHSYGLTGAPYDLAITVPGSSGPGPRPNANPAYASMGVPDLIYLLAQYCDGLSANTSLREMPTIDIFSDPNSYPFEEFATTSYEANTARGQRNRPELTTLLADAEQSISKIQKITTGIRSKIQNCTI